MPKSRRKTPSPKKTRLGKAWLLILVGVILILFPTVYRAVSSWSWPRINPPAIRFPSRLPLVASTSGSLSNEPIRIDSKLLGDKPQTQLPQRVVLPSVAIDLSVVEAPVVNGYWELSDTSASHGVGSANPGENGNIVIFAHAREGLFMNLRNMKVDDTIYILSQDKWFRYKVTEYKLVDPSAVETIAPTSMETLTLYTCDGFLDSKRLIVVAKPQNS